MKVTRLRQKATAKKIVKVEKTKIEKPKEPNKETKQVKHKKYDIIKCCLENSIPVYLAGPAGSGKNYTVEQIAKELEWNFYFSNSVQQEYKLTGFIDAGGKYHDTEFYKACKEASEGKDVVFELRNEATFKGIRATFSYRCIAILTKLKRVAKSTLYS